jgi:hypothetical protein
MRTYVFPTHNLENEPGHYFAPHLISALRYFDEKEANSVNSTDLEKQALFRYLANTESIEIDLINPSLLFIMEGQFEQALHIEAYKIYADEGFHAAMCVGLRESIKRTPVAHPNSCRYRSQPLSELLQVLKSQNKRTEQLRIFFAAAINETLITQSLLQARDPLIKNSIRELIASHAMDEARHHKYFAHMLGVIWDHMTESEQLDIAAFLPSMFKLLLAHDMVAMKEDLVGLGIESNRADAIVSQVVCETSEIDRILTGARGSLHAMAKSGIFNSKVVQQAFYQDGLDLLLGNRDK